MNYCHPPGWRLGWRAVDYAGIAEILHRAERERAAIRPLTETYPGLSVEDAYAIQSAWLHRKLADPAAALVGRKVGLTAKAMQVQLGVDGPGFGLLHNTT